jgi:hypothetical protein
MKKREALSMNIKDILVKTEKSSWVKYIDDFEINVRYLQRSELQKLMERSKSITWDKKDHTKVEKLDTDLFYKLFIDRAIINWRGLTAETLKKMLPIETDDLTIDIPFNVENALELLRGAYDFDTFIQHTVLDIESFNKEQLEVEKKI